MLTYVLLTGRQPFSSPKTDDPMVVMRRIVDDSFIIKFPPYVSPAAKDFVLRLLERKPTKRLGMLQVCRAPDAQLMPCSLLNFVPCQANLTDVCTVWRHVSSATSLLADSRLTHA